MSEICPVCNEEISKFSLDSIQGVDIHDTCREAFYKSPEKYGGKVETIEKTETQTEASEAENLWVSKLKEQEEKSVYKSVNIIGGIDVKSFDMPFGEMVGFMVKWALASIPAFIILFIIFGIFFAIFGALFF